MSYYFMRYTSITSKSSSDPFLMHFSRFTCELKTVKQIILSNYSHVCGNVPATYILCFHSTYFGILVSFKEEWKEVLWNWPAFFFIIIFYINLQIHCSMFQHCPMFGLDHSINKFLSTIFCYLILRLITRSTS